MKEKMFYTACRNLRSSLSVTKLAGIGLSCMIFIMLAFLARPALAADYYEGKRLYRKYCAECHGMRGQGELPNTPDFSHGEGLYQSNTKILAHIRNGNRIAPAFQSTLSETEMRDIVVYLRSLF